LNQPIKGDTLPIGPHAELDLTVVCPFFNEEQIIAEAIHSMLVHIAETGASFELLVVNDGCTDRSAEIAQAIAAHDDRVRVLGYEFNRGRGHALRTGIAQARGNVIVTTEIDLSWGEDIVSRLFTALADNPDVDIVVASPHLPGGGYENVPLKRVLISRFGNWVIRSCMSKAVSMNTGMTRAYRREVIRSMPLEEDRKEFHLEVILKAQALGYRFFEIPAILAWKDYKHEGKRVKRKSSSKINRLIVTHSLFSLFANPIRYVWSLAAASMVLAGGFLAYGTYRFLTHQVSVYMLLVSLAFAMIGVMLFAFGVIAQQGNMVQRELWTLKQRLIELSDHDDEQETKKRAKPLTLTR